MNLLLIRHAIAEDRDPRRWPDDADRPLTQRGIRRFRTAALGLGTLLPEVDRLFTSPFVRAHQTATILEDQLGWPPPEVQPPLASGASIAGVIALIEDCGARSTIAAIGHEPMLSLIASSYLGDPTTPLTLDWRRGGAALIGFESAAVVGAGALRWFMPPRMLRALAAD